MIDDTERLLAQTPPPPVRRLNGPRVAFVALGLCGLLVVYVALTLMGRHRVHQTPTPPPKPGIAEVSGSPQPDVALRLQQSYAGWNRDPMPLPPAGVEPATIAPREPVLASTTPPLPPVAPGLPPAPPGPSETPSPPVPAPRPSAPPGNRLPPPPAQAAQPKSWMQANVQKLAPPFPMHAPQRSQDPPEAQHATPLLRQAHWVKPNDPTRVLYRSQTIHGILLHEVNSDVPGQIRIMVSRPVQDKFGRGQVLVPQHTIMLGEQHGGPVYGDSRLAAAIVELEFPDGTMVQLAKAMLTDKAGAVGGAGKVNNHYTKLGIAAVLSAVLNIGSRGAVGNTSNFQPTFQQDIARDVGSSINQSAQSIVQRELKVPPTITIPAGTAVAVQLQENLSFATPPVRVQ